MNLYPDRIAELHDFLAARYSQRDRQATEILLAAHLPASITQVQKPWLILETDYYNRDTTDAWFSFGDREQRNVKCLSVPRVQRYDPAKSILESWICERSRGPEHGALFVEPEWRRLGTESGRGTNWSLDSTYRILIGMCVRLRVDHPKGTLGLKLNRDQDRIELARLTRRIYSDREQHPARKPSVLAPLDMPGVMNVPPSFLYWCEMVQRLAPRQCNWESLTGQIASIAHGISYLYNDSRSPAWEAAERMLRDNIPATTTWIVREIAAAKQGMKAYTLWRANGAPEQTFYKEVKRLKEERVLVYAGKRYRLGHVDWRTLMDRDEMILV